MSVSHEFIPRIDMWHVYPGGYRRPIAEYSQRLDADCLVRKRRGMGYSAPPVEHAKLMLVDLWQYYDRVEKLIVDLRLSGREAEAERVEIAIRGGATSGEILGRLALALPAVAANVPQFATESEVLAAWAREAWSSG